MAKEYFYTGSSYSLEPVKSEIYTGSSLRAGILGGTTSIQTANQVNEVSNLLNSGMKVAEVSTINADVFEMIPKQQLKEINRLTKLTGTEVTLHSPMIEASGFTQQGGWNEQQRIDAERQFKNVLARAHELSPDKPIPVTIHSTVVLPGTETMPKKLVEEQFGLTPEEKQKYKNETDKVPVSMAAVNQVTGEVRGLKRERRYLPGKPQGEIREPMEELENLNATHWDNQLTQLLFYKERADELLSKGTNYPIIAGELVKARQIYEQQGVKAAEEFLSNLDPQQRVAYQTVQNANIYLKNTHQAINSLFNEAYRASNEEGKEALTEASKMFYKDMETARKTGLDPNRYSQALQGFITTMKKITSEDEQTTPQLYKPLEQFAIEKASETFANAAAESWKKWGNKAPIISIENPPYGQAMSSAENLRALIQESRKRLVEKLMKDGDLRMNKKEAEQAAKMAIGATWDTSHISMMRKDGYDKTELIKQAEIIAPYVKHVHLNDNLGHTHTDLPPGMGDVPFKDILPLLKEQGSKDKKFVFEGGNFFQHYKTSPHGYVLEGIGSPLYSMAAEPTWTRTYGTMGVYSSGYGPFLPENNFSMYGSGFSTLPTELGGQVSGKQSRLSGTPMN